MSGPDGTFSHEPQLKTFEPAIPWLKARCSTRLSYRSLILVKLKYDIIIETGISVEIIFIAIMMTPETTFINDPFEFRVYL